MNYTDDTIVLGSMFFQQFYVGFVNSYSNPLNLFQSAQVYVGSNALYTPYIGSTSLPDGPSPFAPDATGLGILIIIAISAGGFLLLLLILILIICCCCCKKSSEESSAEALIYDTDKEALYEADNNALNEWQQ